jgi:hypothetical protein
VATLRQLFASKRGLSRKVAVLVARGPAAAAAGGGGGSDGAVCALANSSGCTDPTMVGYSASASV